MNASTNRIILTLFLLPTVVTMYAQQTKVFPGSFGGGEVKNGFLYCGNSEKTYQSLFRSMNDLVVKGEGTIKIIQIGDSHIQAGFIPEQLRKNFASFISSGCGARGLIFPYRIAKTNNPADYFVKFTGRWITCRNVQANKSCSLGITGIMAQTRDTLSTMTFHFRENSTFREFNFIRIFHDPLDTSFRVDFPGLAGLYHAVLPIQTGYTDITFDTIISDSLKIRIIKKDTAGKYFTFYGIDFENGDPGIVYSASGVNGAEVTSFLRCDLMKDQLNIIKPDWVILSLGTNDAYPLHFNKDEFIGNYLALVKKIRETNTGVPILLTIPGDSYRRRRNDNQNLLTAREAIFEVASQTDCAVWDFYSLMGGPKSIIRWYKAGLVARDKLHFTRQGYLIQADMLFDAFMDAWSAFIDQSNKTD